MIGDKDSNGSEMGATMKPTPPDWGQTAWTRAGASDGSNLADTKQR